jgi:hypothetical protein
MLSLLSVQIPLIDPQKIGIIWQCPSCPLLHDALSTLCKTVENPLALEFSEYGIEDALFDLMPAFQVFNLLPVGIMVFQVHVERGRIIGTEP